MQDSPPAITRHPRLLLIVESLTEMMLILAASFLESCAQHAVAVSALRDLQEQLAACQKENSSCKQHLEREKQLHATAIREKDRQVDAAAKEVFQLQGFVLELTEGLAQAVQVSCALSSAIIHEDIKPCLYFSCPQD
jgi:cob(I)alamin adenosyltransferase